MSWHFNSVPAVCTPWVQLLQGNMVLIGALSRPLQKAILHLQGFLLPLHCLQGSAFWNNLFQSKTGYIAFFPSQ